MCSISIRIWASRCDTNMHISISSFSTSRKKLFFIIISFERRDRQNDLHWFRRCGRSAVVNLWSRDDRERERERAGANWPWTSINGPECIVGWMTNELNMCIVGALRLNQSHSNSYSNRLAGFTRRRCSAAGQLFEIFAAARFSYSTTTCCYWWW